MEIIGGEGRSTWSEVQYVMLGRKEDVERSWLKEGARGGLRCGKRRSMWRGVAWGKGAHGGLWRRDARSTWHSLTKVELAGRKEEGSGWGENRSDERGRG